MATCTPQKSAAKRATTILHEVDTAVQSCRSPTSYKIPSLLASGTSERQEYVVKSWRFSHGSITSAELQSAPLVLDRWTVKFDRCRLWLACVAVIEFQGCEKNKSP